MYATSDAATWTVAKIREFLQTGLPLRLRDSTAIIDVKEMPKATLGPSFRVLFRSPRDREHVMRALSCKRLDGVAVHFEAPVGSIKNCEIYEKLDVEPCLGHSSKTKAGEETRLLVVNLPESPTGLKEFLKTGIPQDPSALVDINVVRSGVAYAAFRTAQAAFLCARALSGKRLGAAKHISFYGPARGF
ncbi:unnamed protein product [Amoebophrya sp. A25]|nr:unnamed protein product [Amoebophrya sp. A25]|eukprot:GSA25T00025127001.1